MKRFTQKFFLLAIGMVLSVGASAQGDGIKHRFPQLDYTSSDGKTKAFIPAWDVQMYNEGVMPGCIRLQITEVVNLDSENPANNVFKCKIVNRLGNLSDLSNFHYTTSSTSVSFTGLEKDAEGHVIYEDGNPKTKKVSKGAGSVKYSDFIDIDTYDTGTWFEGTDYDHSDYQVFNFKTSGRHYVYGDFVIPEKYVNSKYGEFQITDIDMFAFRNNSVSTTATEYWFRPTSVTIPATIKSIGLGAFLNNRTTTKVTIASNSEISEISPRAFMNMGSLEEINLPASVTTIGGAALGGCTNLKKITFEGATPPTTFGTILWTPSNQPAVTCDWLMANSTSFDNITPANCIIEVPLHSAKNYVNANNRFPEFPMSSKFPITTSSGMTSFCSDYPFTFMQYDNTAATPSWNAGDVKAYYVTMSNVDLKNSNIELTEITETKKIPLENPESDYGFGVILKGEANQTYDIFYPNNLVTDVFTVTENLLQGVTEQTTMEQIDNFVYYALSGGKFHPVQLSDDPDRNKIGAHKAFLMFIPKEEWNLARELTISFPEATGITTHETKSGQNNVFYNLQGVQVKNPGKGVFIKNGKKYIIK